MQPGASVVDSGLNVSDSAASVESISVSVVGAPWLLEMEVNDAASLSESVALSLSPAPVSRARMLLLGVG